MVEPTALTHLGAPLGGMLIPEELRQALLNEAIGFARTWSTPLCPKPAATLRVQRVHY